MKKVIIFGGTHGNEWTGVYAIKKYAESLAKEFPSLDLHFVHANPEAFKINRRFKDEDLNRAFQFLHESRPDSFEHKRARELKDMILKEPCFVLDLHTTTSNMGNTVIISHDRPMNFFVAKNLSEKLSDCRVILSPDPNRKYLASQSEFGMMIEVGPVANGVIDGVVLEGTLQLLREVLSTLSTLSSLTGGSVEIYEEIEDVHYPQNENGEITSYIHKDFQDKDFFAVKGPYIPFKSFEGEDQERVTKEELYPIFINEAAYYPVKLAYTLCRKRILSF
jgi:succinylglutamate desuccinylase